MELEVGQFVRYKNGIGKIVAKYVKGVLLDKGKGGYFRTESIDILKASHNIIDLIEEGDYVNGYKVAYTMETLLGFEDGQDGDWYMSNESIKSIVTKEQFKAMEYRLGDK